MKETDYTRFWSKVDPCRTDGCILFQGRCNPSGYGVFWLAGTFIMAHHFLIGKAPKGLEWDHLCRIRNCIAPEHLEAVTHKENVLREQRVLKEFCKKGHPYDASNTSKDYQGYRRCRKCARLDAITRWRSKHPTARRYLIKEK